LAEDLTVDFPERDWKHLRALHLVAFDRYCSRILEESAAVIADSAASPHERYLRLYRLLRERDATMATAFDDLRRSTATRRLASIVALDLLTRDELNNFTTQTRDTAIGLSELLGPPKRKRVRGRPSR
jgi:hypothetical protein